MAGSSNQLVLEHKWQHIFRPAQTAINQSHKEKETNKLLSNQAFRPKFEGSHRRRYAAQALHEVAPFNGVIHTEKNHSDCENKKKRWEKRIKKKVVKPIKLRETKRGESARDLARAIEGGRLPVANLEDVPQEDFKLG